MPSSPSSGSGDHRAALFASYLGWTLDAFDYFLVVMCLTAIGREFHKTDEQIAIATWVTLAFRPVGAFIFGLIADRYGRRLPLMIDLVFYSIVEVLSGLAPSYTAFLVLRALFGIGMGGEWGVGASLALEKAPLRLRGLISGFLQQGYAMGFLLASLAYNFIFPHYGWRPLFFIGGLPALLALFVRSRVKESEVWERKRHASWVDLRRAILSHWKLLLYLMAFMMAMNLAAHGTQDMYPTFLLRDRGFSVSQRSWATAISMVGAILGGSLFGMLSDRFGRRRTMIVALAGAILGDSAVGVQRADGAGDIGRVPDAVHGARIVGRSAGAFGRAFAGFGARVPAGIRLSDGRAAIESRELCGSGSGEAYRLCGGDVDDGSDILRDGNCGDGIRDGAAGGEVWRVGFGGWKR